MSKERLEHLTTILKEMEYAYHTQGLQTSPDSVYDQLRHEKETLERKFNIVTDRSVGAKSSKQRVPHLRRMLSLKDVFNKTELFDWIAKTAKQLGERFCLSAEFKNDGLAISIHYRNGKLRQVLTRGDGVLGEDVTTRFLMLSPNWSTINIPNSDADVEIRGEGVVLTKDFLALNELLTEQDKPTYSTQRHLAAAMLRGMSTDITGWEFIPYEVFGTKATSQTDKLLILEELFSNKVTSDTPRINLMLAQFQGVRDNTDTLSEFIDDITDARQTLPHLIDGIVFKVTDLKQQAVLGEATSEPKWAVAYKFQSEGAWSYLRDVTWQVGRTRVLTPVATIDPVLLGGVEVTNPTLHNYGEIHRLEVAIGSRIYVERRADVIPKIMYAEPTKGVIAIEYPERCPCCDELTLEDGAYIRCSNVRCTSALTALMLNAVSRAGYDISGIGPVLVQTLVDSGHLTHPLDVYKLNMEVLTTVAGLSPLVASKLLDEINDKSTITLTQFIYALGIPGVGKIGAQKLAGKYSSILSYLHSEDTPVGLFDYMSSISAEHLPTITAVTAMVDLEPVCVTGSFNLPRDEIARLLELQGYKVTSSVTKNTSWLLCGKKPTVSKENKARELGKTIVRDSNYTGHDLKHYLRMIATVVLPPQ